MKYFNRIISAVLIIALVFCTYPESFFYVKANGSTSSNDISDNEISVYTVTFDSDGGSSVDSQEVKEGELVTKPSDPKKDGYVFDGWYHEDTPWNFDSSKVTSDVTLTAMYKEKSSVSSNVLEVSPKDEGTESDPDKGIESDPIFSAPKNMLRGPLRAPMANSSEGHELKVTIWLNTGKACTESVTQTFTITDEELSESFPEPRKGNQSEAFLDGKLSFPSEDGYVFSCANYYELKLQRNSDSKYQITVYAYYIATNSTTLMPIDIDYTDYPRPKYPSVQNAVGSPCVNGAPVKFEWSDEPLNAENATEVQMPGSAHKIYGVYNEKEENGETYHVFSLYTSASKVYLIEPEYGFSNIQYFDFSNFDMSNVFYRDRGDVWEENDNYNYEILFGDLVEVDLSGAYGLDDFCFPSTDPQESLEILNLGNAKWPRMATVLAWQDAAGATTWYYSDDNYPSLKVLDLRNVDFSDVPTIEKDGKQIIRCDYSILADGYTRYDEDNYEDGYPCWYHDEEDGLGEDGKPLPGDNAPKMVYIDDDEDGVAEGEVNWSMEMTVEDMKHRFVTADMATLPPEVHTVKVHFVSQSSGFASAHEKIVAVDCNVGEKITLSKNVKKNDFYDHTFDGWYTPSGEELDLSSYLVTKDLTDIYAMYMPVLNFKDTKDYSSYSKQVDYNTCVSQVPEPKEVSGKTFVGWKYVKKAWYPSLGEADTTEPAAFDQGEPVTRDLVLTPEYEDDGSSSQTDPSEDTDTVTITFHEMVKDGDSYVEKSVQDLQMPVQMATDEAMDITGVPLSSIITAFSYMGYKKTVNADMEGLSNSGNGPSNTIALPPNGHMYIFYGEEVPDDGSVAIMVTGKEFQSALQGLVRRECAIQRVNSLDEFDMEDAVTISTYYSPYPIYANTSEDDSHLINIYTEASTIELNEDCSFMFSGVYAADLGKFDSSKVKNMSFMFVRSYCSDLISSLDTSGATNMAGMFMYSLLDKVDLSSFDTSNVENMGLMFARSSLKEINLSSLRTGKVKNMAGMFYGDTALTSLDLSSFDTSNVESMMGMFAGVSLDELDLSNFNTNKVRNMDHMFYNSEYNVLDISGFTFDSVSGSMPTFIMGAKVVRMGKVSSGKNVGFTAPVYYLDDNEDGQVDSSAPYARAIDDNSVHTYRMMIKINYYDGDVLMDEQFYSKLTSVAKPADPTKDRMTFVGWESENGELFNFDNPNTHDSSFVVNLYARWVPSEVITDECKVTCYTESGSAPYEVWVKKGSKIKPFDEPFYLTSVTEDGEDFNFLGWCKEDGSFWDFDSDVVNSDVVLYAVFDPAVVEVYYLYGSDSEIEYITVPYGETLSTDDFNKDGIYNIKAVKWFGWYKKTSNSGLGYSVYRDFSLLESDAGSKLSEYDFSTPVICPMSLYVDCDKVKWKHKFYKEVPESFRSNIEESTTPLQMVCEDNLCYDEYVAEGASFTPPEFSGSYVWVGTDGTYQKGESILASNKDGYYYMVGITETPVEVGSVALFNESGAMKTNMQSVYQVRTEVKYGDVLKPPAGDKVSVLGAPTYKWVAIPGSKSDEFQSAMMALGEDVTAEDLEAVVQSGIGSYYTFDEESLSEKYTIDELIDNDTSKPTIRLYQIPAAVNYKLTIPDEISANDHSFQVSFDCGNHFCNDVTVTFDPGEVFLPNTGYTVSLYEDASFSKPLTSLTFKEKGSKTVYIKAEPEDGAARVGQDSVEIAFEISDLGYDEEVEAANN